MKVDEITLIGTRNLQETARVISGMHKQAFKGGRVMTASTRRFAQAAAAAFITLIAVTPTAAQNPSGYAIKVDPRINATGPGGQRLIELQGAVFMGDQIVAGPVGMAQIKFIDNTRLVVGPNSRLTIDTFVFNPDMTARDVTITALKGTFRFIRGSSQPGVYTIRTPTSTLGIRG